MFFAIRCVKHNTAEKKGRTDRTVHHVTAARDNNPVDGLSRQDFTRRRLCNWIWKHLDFPKKVRSALRLLHPNQE